MGVKSTVHLTREDAISRIESHFESLDDEGLARVLGVLEDELSRMSGYGDESSYNYQVSDAEDAEDVRWKECNDQ